MAKKMSAKAIDREIDRIYREHCSGMQLNIMRIPALFKMARPLVEEHVPDQSIGAAMVAFIEAE